MRCLLMSEDKEKIFFSRYIYIHNRENQTLEDEENIELFLDMIRRTFENNFSYSEIICVNDASKYNNVLEKIKKLSQLATTTTISVINMSHYHGLELSMNAGVDLAISDFVFEFDDAISDFPVEVIIQVYRRSLQGYDIVSASPKGKREISSRLFYWFLNKLNPESIIWIPSVFVF